MAAPSFYFCIFKKLQLVAGVSTGGYPHCRLMPENLGFNMTSSDAKGFFHALDPVVINDDFLDLVPLIAGATPQKPVFPVLPPDASNANVPAANPLYAMLKASLKPDGTIVESYFTELTVPVAGSTKLWPVMPQCQDAASMSDFVKMWLGFNKPGSARLLDAFHDWFVDGRPDDTPKQALNFTQPAHTSSEHPVVFVCSRIGDDGVRPGVGLDSYWTTSRIFLVHASGISLGKKAYPTHLEPGKRYNLVAQIGNSGTQAGRSPGNLTKPKVRVFADAFPFSTWLGTLGVPLPALSHIDASSGVPEYEQYFAAPDSYDLAGFRFDVDAVQEGLVAAVETAVAQGLDIGGATPAQWVAGSVPCVKVRIGISGAGTKDASNKLPTLDLLPPDNPRIAQKNLVTFGASFFPTTNPDKKTKWPWPWQHFIVAQPPEFFGSAQGASKARLTLHNGFPADAYTLLLAIPTGTFKRYFPGNKGLAGFEVVTAREIAKVLRGGRLQPFPEAVFLRATGERASLELTLQAKRRLIGMSLGIVYHPASRGASALGTASMVHEALRPRAGTPVVAGGFTIRVVADEAVR